MRGFAVLAVLLQSALAAVASPGAGDNKPLIAAPGERAAIPHWSIQSSANAGNDIVKLSQAGLDVSSWYTVSSRSTIMAGLLENGVYNDAKLFFSNNLETMVDYSQFTVPWFYRHEFSITLEDGQFYFLQTNGIASKADIYLNGKTVATKVDQAGAYGGKEIDVTSFLNDGENVLLIQAYPTDYNKDFALGFVDWNPYPPDNGTGVWRDIVFRQTGPVVVSKPRIVTDFEKQGVSSVKVTVKVDVHNNRREPVDGILEAVLSADAEDSPLSLSEPFSLGEGESKTLSLILTVEDPQIWWPWQWGDQPLYTAKVQALVDDVLSDASKDVTFGIRHVTSEVNAHDDRIFSINSHPFQVLGGGYSSDMFLRFDEAKLATQFQYMIDLGLNTVRLEGKMEHPELYEIADRMGIMVITGWECCDKWEAWDYNEDVTAELWNDNDYQTANLSMRHEATMLQNHPSILAFLVGSDYWPDERAVGIYVEALNALDWTNPVVCSASKRGYPDILGPSGMKMEGPYDWVPPNYWYNDELGGAFGFGSELGAGVGTPEIGSLKKFLSSSDLEDLWKAPTKGLYHMSTNVSQFYDRSIYNEALYKRYGEPTSLEDYLLKAQMMDYEATRAEFEGFAARWNDERPATGLIYWMLQNAWPSLHWNLFDYYLAPAGSYYGAKVGSRMEHVAYNYLNGSIYLINHSLDIAGSRTVNVQIIGLDGKPIHSATIEATTEPNTSKIIANVAALKSINGTALLRLTLNEEGNIISRNVYWLTSGNDVLDWENSTWYHTPVTSFVNYTAISHLPTASLAVTNTPSGRRSLSAAVTVTLKNESDIPAVFIRLTAVDENGENVLPVYWSDNYVTLWPGEKLDVSLKFDHKTVVGKVSVEVSGRNVEAKTVPIN